MIVVCSILLVDFVVLVVVSSCFGWICSNSICKFLSQIMCMLPSETSARARPVCWYGLVVELTDSKVKSNHIKANVCLKLERYKEDSPCPIASMLFSGTQPSGAVESVHFVVAQANCLPFPCVIVHGAKNKTYTPFAPATSLCDTPRPCL